MIIQSYNLRIGGGVQKISLPVGSRPVNILYSNGTLKMIVEVEEGKDEEVHVSILSDYNSPTGKYLGSFLYGLTVMHVYVPEDRE